MSDHFFSHDANDVARLTAERDALKAIVDQVDAVLVVDWINPPGLGGDYRLALHQLVEYNQKLALDPAVSSAAAKLTADRDALKAIVDQVNDALFAAWIDAPGPGGDYRQALRRLADRD